MFPDWYGGGFPDAEKLMESLFAPLLTGVTLVPWLPKPGTYETELAAGNAFLRIRRTGGSIDFDQNRDEPRVQFAAVAGSRSQSWDLIEFCRQVLFDGFRHGSVVPGTPHQLLVSGEVLGPQLIAENIVEPRLVPATFGLCTWKPGGLNYRKALGL